MVNKMLQVVTHRENHVTSSYTVKKTLQVVTYCQEDVTIISYTPLGDNTNSQFTSPQKAKKC